MKRSLRIFFLFFFFFFFSFFSLKSPCRWHRAYYPTGVFPSPIDQIWTNFDGKKSSDGRYFFWLKLQQKVKLFWNINYLIMTIGGVKDDQFNLNSTIFFKNLKNLGSRNKRARKKRKMYHATYPHKKMKNYATSSNLYWSFNLHRSRELVSPVCGILISHIGSKVMAMFPDWANNS